MVFERIFFILHLLLDYSLFTFLSVMFLFLIWCARSWFGHGGTEVVWFGNDCDSSVGSEGEGDGSAIHKELIFRLAPVISCGLLQGFHSYISSHGGVVKRRPKGTSLLVSVVFLLHISCCVVCSQLQFHDL